MNEISKQIKEMEKKAEKYDELKKQLDDFFNGFKEHVKDLEDYVKNNPFSIPTMSIKSMTSSAEIKEQVNAVLGWLKEGKHMSRDDVTAMLNIKRHKAIYVFNKVRENPNVEERKDGRRVFLYRQPRGMRIKMPKTKLLREEVKQEKLGEIPEGGVVEE